MSVTDLERKAELVREAKNLLIKLEIYEESKDMKNLQFSRYKLDKVKLELKDL